MPQRCQREELLHLISNDKMRSGITETYHWQSGPFVHLVAMPLLRHILSVGDFPIVSERAYHVTGALSGVALIPNRI